MVHTHGPLRVVALDSISMLDDSDRRQIVISGSNGGLISGHMARLFETFCVAFNDAGFGKDDAGVEGIAYLDEHGLPALAVSHDSAEISDGVDMWESGVISHVNRAARVLGFAEGRSLRDALIDMLNARVPLGQPPSAADGDDGNGVQEGDLR